VGREVANRLRGCALHFTEHYERDDEIEIGGARSIHLAKPKLPAKSDEARGLTAAAA
jgi:hypothetical protein